MYANIYQVSHKPIFPNEWFNEWYFYDINFLGRIADKVEKENDRENAINSLHNRLTNAKLGSVTNEQIILSPNMDESPYFQKKYQDFKKAVTELSRIDYHNFLWNIDGVSNAFYKIASYWKNQFDDYVYWDTESLVPMDEFLRTAPTGTAYYIGGICKFKY